jgi:hypothetical protein
MPRTILLLVVTMLLRAPASTAQDTLRTTAGVKSPVAARVIGIVPGAGHIYAGETKRGLTYLGATIGVFLLGATLWASECIGSLGEQCEESGAVSDDIAVVATLGVWGWSIYDAGRAAHRTNAKRKLKVSLSATPTSGNHGRSVRIGLTLSTR